MDNVKVQFDLYHTKMGPEGFVSDKIANYLSNSAYIQVRAGPAATNR